MDFKKIKVSEKKLKEVVEYESNFGWVQDNYEKKILTLSRNIDKKYALKLNKIERQIKSSKKIFPFGAVLYLLIAGGLVLFKYKFFPTFDFSFLDDLDETKDLILKILGYVMIGFAGIFAIVAIAQIILFIIKKAQRKKEVQRLLSLSKELTGQYCKLPLKSCIKEPGPESNILAKIRL